MCRPLDEQKFLVEDGRALVVGPEAAVCLGLVCAQSLEIDVETWAMN